MTTMKKWFFSKNGKINGPLNEIEAKDFLLKDPDCYGWHPSFTQWKPVHSIREFTDLVPTPIPPAQIPKALIDEFTSKKKSLDLRLDNINENIKFTKTYLYEFEQEINIYKRLTHNLSDEVKANIHSIEQQYENLQKNFNELVNASTISKSEINNIVTDFNARVALRGADSIPAPVTEVAPGANINTDNVSKIRSTINLVENESKQASTTIVDTPVKIKTVESTIDFAPIKTNIASKKVELPNNNTEEVVTTSGFSGVKNIFKSVFKGDSIDTREQDNGLAKLLSDDEDDEDEHFEDGDGDSDADKESRMRRRRRRR